MSAEITGGILILLFVIYIELLFVIGMLCNIAKLIKNKKEG